MPDALTLFAAQYLVFIEALLVVPLVLFLLYREPPLRLIRWAIAVSLMLVIAEGAAQIGGTLYRDPRPFVIGHFHPLLAHAADNGFPSDHALLAAAILGAVLLLRPLWALCLAPLAVVVEWARVGAGVHHPIDVLGSDLFVAAGLLIGFVLAPYLAPRILPYVPPVLFQVLAEPHDAAA